MLPSTSRMPVIPPPQAGAGMPVLPPPDAGGAMPVIVPPEPDQRSVSRSSIRLLRA